MPRHPETSKGVDNPWYPEGGPGRHLKARLKRGDVLIGATIEAYAHPSLVKLFRHAGFDFVYIEYEHSLFDLQDLADTILAARDNGLPVIAKTPQLERQEVSKLLEAGVVGIQLPRTETREEVQRLLSYLKFPPAGTRAVAPGWGNSDYREVADWRGWMEEQDRETALVVHLETVRGYRNAEEILSIPGVDMCFVGPGDTSIEFGHPGDFDHPEVRGPMERALNLCKAHGVAFGTMPWSGISAGEWARRGATFFEATSELGFIRAGAAALLGEYRAHLNSGQETPTQEKRSESEPTGKSAT